MNMKFTLFLFVSGLLLLFSNDAAAQTKQRVRFAKNATGTTISGTVRGFAYKDYIVGVRAGQTISVKLNSKNTFTVLTIFTPDGDNLEGATEMDEFSGELPTSGDYVIRVGMMRAEARRKNSIANYSLRLSVQ
jgi:hypothetical protein